MKVAELSQEVREAITAGRYDWFVEKHEGPLDWKFNLTSDDEEYPPAEFLNIAGVDVLLPRGSDHHKNITILRSFFSEDRQKLVVFLKDTTYVEDERAEFLQAGFVAICEQFPHQDFYVATFYHEWFLLPEIAPTNLAKGH